MEACLHPRYRNGKAFPCGQCPSCLTRDREELAQRLIVENAVSKIAYFITLTYSDEYLPICKDTGVNCFDKDQVRKFIRSLRDYYRDDGINFRYFVTSEYGDTTNRSHYHGIFYYNSFQSRQQVYEDIKKKWPYGQISVDSVSMASARYVAKYCLKDDGTQDLPKGHPNKPFRLFSTKPALGCSTEALKWYKENFKLQERFIRLDDTEFVKNCQLIDKIPRVVRDKVTIVKKYKKTIVCDDGTKYRKTMVLRDLDMMKKLTAVGWSRFFQMVPDLHKSLNDKSLNRFDGKTSIPDYSKDLEIKEKTRKLRKLKKHAL